MRSWVQAWRAVSPWRWLGRHRRVRRVVLTMGALWTVLVGVATTSALADGFSGKSAAPAEISWMGLTDTHGVPIWAFQIAGPSSDLHPIASLWVSLAQLFFTVYLDIAAYAIWAIDWVTSFEWFHLLNDPAASIAGKFSIMLSQIHAAPLFMAVAGLVALIHYGRGRTSSAIYEMVATWVIAALATGMLANPIGATGGDQGWIMQTRAGALEMAGAVITPMSGDVVMDSRTGKVIEQPTVNVSTDTEALQKQLTSSMVDVFVRQPAQLISYGKVLDRGGCESAFTDVTKNGPYSDPATPMDKIAGCDETAGKFADNPSAHQAISSLILSPAALVVLALALIIGGAVIGAVAMILYVSIKMLWDMVVALLPGQARGGLMMSLGEILAGLGLLGFSVFILAVYQALVAEMFTDASSDALPKTFVEADIMLLAMLYLYKRQKTKIQASAQRIAQLLATRPGGSTPVPARAPMSPAKALAGMEAARFTARKLQRRHATQAGAGAGAGSVQDPSEARQHFSATQINFFGAPTTRRRTDPNVTVTQVPTTEEPRPSAAERLAVITGKSAGHAVLSHATGGASTALLAAQRLRKLAAARQRAALAGTQQPTSLPPAPHRAALGPGPSRGQGARGDAPAGATAAPRAPRPRPGGGGGLAGWLRGRRKQEAPSGDGYTRITTGGAAVLVPNQTTGPAARPAGGGVWRRLRRR